MMFEKTDDFSILNLYYSSFWSIFAYTNDENASSNLIENGIIKGESRWKDKEMENVNRKCTRIDAFELWCWTRLLRVPWTARRSNQSILKEISPGCSLEGLMLKLKLQSFGHLMRRADSLEKTLMLGKIEDKWKRGRRRIKMVGWHHQINGHEFEQVLGVGDGQGSLMCCSPWGCKESDRT